MEGLSIDVRNKFILPDYVHIYLTKPVRNEVGTAVDTKEVFDVTGDSASPSIVGADDLEIPGIVRRNDGRDIYIKIVDKESLLVRLELKGETLAYKFGKGDNMIWKIKRYEKLTYSNDQQGEV
jgi:hypothetical protein